MTRLGNKIADSDPRWQLLDKLFNDNYLNYQDSKVNVIPKKIHQIWLGSPLPEKFKKLTDTWQRLNPEWEYKLWTDKDVKDIQIEKMDMYNAAKNFGMKSDILRYEILAQQGGVYVDTDFECLKPFDSLRYLYFFASSAYTEYPYIYNSLIATIPHHHIIELCKTNLDIFYSGDKSAIIMNGTGPYYFTKCFYSGIRHSDNNVVVFPVDYFFPLHHTDRNMENPMSCIKEVSFAIHYWAVSWMKKKN